MSPPSLPDAVMRSSATRMAPVMRFCSAPSDMSVRFSLSPSSAKAVLASSGCLSTTACAVRVPRGAARHIGGAEGQIGARHVAAGQKQVAASQIGADFQRVERAGGGALQHGRAGHRGLQRFGQNGETRQAGAPLRVEGVVPQGGGCRQRHMLAVDLQVGQIDRAVGADRDQTDQIHLAADQGIGGRRAGPQIGGVAGEIGPHQGLLIAAG